MNTFKLITSSDCSTSDIDGEIVLLGSWCQKNRQQKVGLELNVVMANPYGVEILEKERDLKITEDIADGLLQKIAIILNEYHGQSRSVRYWKIIIGKWLKTYVELIFNRHSTLVSCFNEYSIDTVYIGRTQSNTITKNLEGFKEAIANDFWNNEVVFSILEDFFIEKKIIKRESIEIEKKVYSKLTSFNLIKKIIQKIYQNISKIFSFDDGPMFISPYLSKKLVYKFMLNMKVFPVIWTTPVYNLKNEPDRALRSHLKSKLVNENSNIKNVEYVIKNFVFKYIPTCYLEDFRQLEVCAENQGRPKKPKFIFTSNSFEHDEVFKIWVANKIESGIPYIVGQHGNNYGTNKFTRNTVEEVTADKFITWGWGDKEGNHYPGFAFKPYGIFFKSQSASNLLIIVQPHDTGRKTWDTYWEIERYYREQSILIKELKRNILSETIVRLPPGHGNSSSQRVWNDMERWGSYSELLAVEPGKKNIQTLVASSKITLCSYDSTLLLELLSDNVPVVGFWSGGFDHIIENARPYYGLLLKAEILHFSPESAADFINKNWDNIDEWWNSSEVQKVRLEFCQRYCNHTKDKYNELKKFFATL